MEVAATLQVAWAAVVVACVLVAVVLAALAAAAAVAAVAVSIAVAASVATVEAVAAVRVVLMSVEVGKALERGGVDGRVVVAAAVGTSGFSLCRLCRRVGPRRCCVGWGRLVWPLPRWRSLVSPR
jgi:hypothetical protein